MGLYQDPQELGGSWTPRITSFRALFGAIKFDTPGLGVLVQANGPWN